MGRDTPICPVESAVCQCDRKSKCRLKSVANTISIMIFRSSSDCRDNKSLSSHYDVEIAPGKVSDLALIAAGSFTTAEDCLKEYCYMRDNYGRLYETTKNHFRNISTTNLRVTEPSDQKQNLVVAKLVRAFEKAKTSMEYLKARYDELGAGICAGLPRFPNYWARDTGWSLKGYLSIGDYEFVLSVLENFLNHQAR